MSILDRKEEGQIEIRIAALLLPYLLQQRMGYTDTFQPLIFASATEEAYELARKFITAAAHGGEIR